MSNVLRQMLDLRVSAHKQHCRITRWNLTKADVSRLVDEVPNYWGWDSAYDVVLDKIRRGEVRILGAQITVKP